MREIKYESKPLSLVQSIITDTGLMEFEHGRSKCYNVDKVSKMTLILVIHTYSMCPCYMGTICDIKII